MKWLYRNKKINEISDLPNNAFGFVYQTTHLPTNKVKRKKPFGKVRVDLLFIKEYLKKVIGKLIMVHIVLLKKQTKKI